MAQKSVEAVAHGCYLFLTGLSHRTDPQDAKQDAESSRSGTIEMITNEFDQRLDDKELM